MNKNSLKFALVLAFLGLAGMSCGAPSYCKKGAYPEFYEEDWKPYCQSFMSHVEEPGLYSVEELTAFLTRHPDKVKQLKKDVGNFEKGVDACFESEREKLEYRDLNSCLDYDAEQQLKVVNAWKARIDPWLEDHEARVRATKPQLGDAKRDAGRLMRKVSHALEFSLEADPSLYEDWTASLEALDSKIASGRSMQEEWENTKELAESSEDLSEVMTNEIEPQVDALAAKIVAQRERHDDLLLLRQYLEFGVYGSGKACPTGLKASKETRIAKAQMKSKIKAIKGTPVRVSSTIVKERKDAIDYQSFKGFVCGDRSREHQYTEQPKLCSKHMFKIQREKPIDNRKWSSWKVVEFEEAGPNGGVDCGIISK